MTGHRVVITGMGTINPLGHDVESTWKAMLACRSGIGPIELFDARTFPSTFAAQVKGFELTRHVAGAERHEHAGRHCGFAIAAAGQAWRQAGLADLADLDRARLGIYLGSGEGSLDFDNFTSTVVDAWRDGRVDTTVWAELAFQRMQLHRDVEQESNMVDS